MSNTQFYPVDNSKPHSEFGEAVFDYQLTEPRSLLGLYPPGGQCHPNQDHSFPFLYNPCDDTYLGFRWDYEEEGPLIPPLTQEMLGLYNGLFLTTHPYHYHSPWVKQKSRLTEVFFKHPKVLITNCQKQFRSWIDVKKPEHTGLPGLVSLHPSLQWYVDQGYNALMCLETEQCAPEILLLNPQTLVTGAQWRERGKEEPLFSS